MMAGGTTLYFSSEGHSSMGGYDIFFAKWDPENNVWGKPQNLGYPINTPDDNTFICFAGKTGYDPQSPKKYGYISAYRPDGYGDLDIYRIIFEEIEPRFTAIRGKIVTQVPVPPTPPADKNKKQASTVAQFTYQPVGTGSVIVTDIKTGEEVGSYLPNQVTGKFVLILPPSDYKIEISADGYVPLSEEFSVLDKGSFKAEIEKEFVLKPVK
ncbi:MAG: carboxypeptidase regulatory-like domain-containing protein [Bacteroidetes bacterium]|nr:carboxypeptidase regulatory-like domain-containing protein [Bacteroidota bacterium]